MNQEDKRVIKTKREIRSALLKILEGKPLSEITVKEIADRACINRKTFYSHYASPDEILSELEDEIVGSIAYFFEDVMIDEYSLGPQHFLQFINTLYASNPQFFENLVSMRNYTFIADKLKKVLKDEILRSMEIPEDKTASASAALEYFIGGAAAVYVDWIREGKQLPFDDVSRLITGLMLDGVRGIREFREYLSPVCHTV